MSDFNANDYLQGMEDYDSLNADAGNADTANTADSGADNNTQQPKDADVDSTAQTGENISSQDDAKAETQSEAEAENSADLSEDSKDSAKSKEVNKTEDADNLTPLGKAKKEAAEYLEALQRERAEFINFRNRTKKEQERFREHGITDVLSALLPALDDIDRIREHSEMDDSFKAVASKIDKAFEKFRVEKFGEKGEDFDPTKHDAILHRPDPDATKETVDAVVEAGYRIGDRVIRAARVVVASPQQ